MPPVLKIDLPLLKWSEWDADHATQQSLPPLAFVEPMVRRRLSSLAKMSLWVAHECAYDQPQVRMIYASRHGELPRTTEMLNDLASNEPLSPTAFSMSVLNASVGLYSITQANTAPATAISAGADTFAAGLLEAYVQLQAHPQAKVLLIYADEPVPEILLKGEPVQAGAHALALLFGAGESQQISMTQLDPTDATSTETSQARTFMQGLTAAQTNTWRAAQAGWEWGYA